MRIPDGDTEPKVRIPDGDTEPKVTVTLSHFKFLVECSKGIHWHI